MVPSRSDQQANIDLVQRLGALTGTGFANPTDDVLADDFVFHYVNDSIPELSGDYHGAEGLRSLFSQLRERTDTDFQSEPHSLTPYGDELVVAYATHTLSFDGTTFDVDAIVVWRVFDGRIHEAWDIPATNTVRFPEQRTPAVTPPDQN